MLNERKMNPYGVGAGCVAVLACFLPVIRLGGNDAVRIMDATDGMKFLIVAIAGTIFATLGVNILSSISGVILLTLFYLKFSILYEKGNDIWENLVVGMIKKEYGFYIFILAALFMVIFGIKGILDEKKQGDDT